MKYLSIITLCSISFLLSCDETKKTERSLSDTTRYDVVFRETVAGEFKKWSTAPNSSGYYYNYTDRGRGPELSEEITLNDQNFITHQSIAGVNYLKDTVSERFISNGENASWMNSGGKGENSFYGNQLYFRYDGSPAIHEILARLLNSSPDKKVKLYPEGEAELVDEYTLKLKNDISVTLMMIKGLDMNPSFLWVDGDQMIARISGNLHVVRADMKSARSEMKALQDSIEDMYLVGLAQRLTHEIGSVVIKNVNVFTSKGSILPSQDVFVSSDRIEAVIPTGTNPINENVKVIDGSNKTLMPGMFDMHTHNSKFRGALHIAGGITSVRDLANNKQVMALGDQFNDNEIIGPRIVTYSGIIDGPGPFANQRNAINNLEEGLEEIQVYKDMGYQQIKLYSSIKPEWVAPMIEKAHKLGMRVSGHIPAYMTAGQAINQGYDEIQHMNMLFLNFLPDTIDTRTPLRFTMVAKHGADLDLSSGTYLEFIDLLKSKQILIDPTVSIFENMFISIKGEPSPTYREIIDRLPLMNQRRFYSGGLPKPEGKKERFEESYGKMLEVVADLYRRGVAIAPGTDGLPGFLYHRELELYTASGIPAKEVLRLATIKAAEITGVADSYGSVEAGKQADLILIDGNPTENISDIRRVEWTMKGGNLFYADELYASMGIKHFK